MEEIVTKPFVIIEKENVKYVFDSHWLMHYFLMSARFINPYTQRELNLIEVKRLSKLIPRSCVSVLMVTWDYSAEIRDALRASTSVLMDYEQRAGADLDNVMTIAEDESDIEDDYDNTFASSLSELREVYPHECYNFLLRCKMLVDNRQRNLTMGGFDTIVQKLDLQILAMRPFGGVIESRPGLCVWL
jgi:hypothetical protein